MRNVICYSQCYQTLTHQFFCILGSTGAQKGTWESWWHRNGLLLLSPGVSCAIFVQTQIQFGFESLSLMQDSCARSSTCTTYSSFTKFGKFRMSPWRTRLQSQTSWLQSLGFPFKYSTSCSRAVSKWSNHLGGTECAGLYHRLSHHPTWQRYVHLTYMYAWVI